MAFIESLTITSLLYVVCVVIALYSCFKFFSRTRYDRFPPGPKGVPLLGHLSPVSHLTLWDHADLYGDVSGFHVVGTNVVVLNTIDAIRDAFQSPRTAEVFSARFPSFFRDFVIYDDVLMRSIHERNWKAQRKMLHSALRVYGEGIEEIEMVVSHELDHVKSILHSRVGKAVDIDDYLAPSVLNIIYTLLNGERYDYDDTMLQFVLEGNSMGNRLANPLIDTLLSTFPFLKYLPFGIGTTCSYVKKSSEVFLRIAFEQCRNMSIEDRNTSKGISFELLRQLEKLDWMTEELAKGCVQDVGGAGNITTRNSLYTFFLILVHYPEVQSQIQEEIDATITRDRNPIIADRKYMPYTTAAILELTRYGSNVAMSVPHSCSADTEFRGVTIPRNAIIIPNLFRIHHDEKLWKDPWLFNPNRFLDEFGDLLPVDHSSRRNLIPFGIGKRVCMGETFAKTRLFLYVTSLLQHYTFLPSGKLPSCDPRTYIPDLVIRPPPYKLQVQERH